MSEITEAEAIDRALSYARDHAQRLYIYVSPTHGCSIDVDRPRNLWGSGRTLGDAWERFFAEVERSAAISATWSATALKSLFESALAKDRCVYLTVDFRKPKGRAFTAEVQHSSGVFRSRPSTNAESAVAEALDLALAS